MDVLRDLSVVWGDPPDVLGLGDYLMGDWMLQLLRLRSHSQADRHLQGLLQALIWRQGCRVSQAYWLPFSLSHGRLAELIGATRPIATGPTATRALQQPRRSGQLRDHPDQPGWLFQPDLLKLA